jgi:hypothetical protein
LDQARQRWSDDAQTMRAHAEWPLSQAGDELMLCLNLGHNHEGESCVWMRVWPAAATPDKEKRPAHGRGA